MYCACSIPRCPRPSHRYTRGCVLGKEQGECSARLEINMAAPKAITCFATWLDTSEEEQVIAGGVYHD